MAHMDDLTYQKKLVFHEFKSANWKDPPVLIGKSSN